MNPKLPSQPTIKSCEAINCGRAIKVEWDPPPTISPITEYQIILKSSSDDSKQIFNLSSKERSYKFVGLKINAVYEVSLVSRNSEGFSPPAKQQLRTTVGTTNVPLSLSF